MDESKTTGSSPLTARRFGRLAGRLDDLALELAGLMALTSQQAEGQNVNSLRRVREVYADILAAQKKANDLAKYLTAHEAKER